MQSCNHSRAQGACHHTPDDASSSASRGLSRRTLLRGGTVAALVAGGARLLPNAFSSAQGLDLASIVGASPADARARGAVHLAAPHIVTRAEWGANEARRGGGEVYDDRIEKIIVHHTASPNSITHWGREVRAIYEMELGRGYRDIAYHYLIDPDGRIYEGRWARDYPEGVTHDGENAFGRAIRGGHALRHNHRTIGIAVLGDYTKTALPSDAYEALLALVAWKCGRWGIDPSGRDRYVNDAGATVDIPNIAPHGAVRATLCPGEFVLDDLARLRRDVATRLETGVANGYWVVSADGDEVAFGGVPSLRTHNRTIGLAGVAATGNGAGYWAFAPDGGVFSFGPAQFHGSAAGKSTSPIVGMAATRSGAGYWLAAADGGVFSFGDADFHGSAADKHHARIVAITATPRDRGYWLAAADGGVYSFGDARFHGSATRHRPTSPIVDMAATPSGRGYWLAAADGGVFSFGDADFHGSGARRRSRGPIVGIASSGSGRGYLLLGEDGHVMRFGDAEYHGRPLRELSKAVGMASGRSSKQ